MKSRWLLLGLMATLAQAAPDRLMFVTRGSVFYAPAGADKARKILEDVEGWEYTLPTWLDYHNFVVMRLKDGQLGRSQIGVGVPPDAGKLAVSDLNWLTYAGGSINIGVWTGFGRLGFTKLARNDDNELRPIFSLFDADGTRISSRYYLKTADLPEGGLPRLRFSPSGRQVVVPAFDDGFSVPLVMLETTTGKRLEPLWLQHRYLVDALGTPRVQAVGWLSDGRVLVGVARSGLYAWHPNTKQFTALDVRKNGSLTVHEISVTADGERAYYGVDLDDDDGPRQEVRYLDADGRTRTLYKDAGWPDAEPAAG